MSCLKSFIEGCERNMSENKDMNAKQTLFISYCWKDGTVYADELEKQLAENFDVKRDKSQLGCNDDIDLFMRKIAECDNVVIVLTKEYLFSLNCMKEVTYLAEQPDWHMKSMILVIESEIYCWENQKNVIINWIRERDSFIEATKNIPTQKLFIEQKNSLEGICNKIEDFFIELKKRNNPSQIAIVNEINHMAKRDRSMESKLIDNEKQKVEKLIQEKKSITITQIKNEAGITREAARRFVGDLCEEGKATKSSYDHVLYVSDQEVVNAYLNSIGKKSVEQLNDEEYDEMSVAIAIAHQHM